jgi:hypothetical protein
MTQLLTVIGTLAIILIGIAVLLQITSIEDALSFIGRAVGALVLTILALCILKSIWVGVMVPWLSAALAFLKALIGWFVVTVIGVTALLIVGRVVVRRARRYLTLRRDPQTGDGYEIHDSKDTKN